MVTSKLFQQPPAYGMRRAPKHAREETHADAWSDAPRKAETRVRYNPEVEIWERTLSVADDTSERPVHEERRKVMTESTLFAVRRSMPARSVDQSASLRVCNRFEAIVRAELAVDVVKVIAKGLPRDAELARNGCRIIALSEQ